MITVLTPTFNRNYVLKNLFDSLKRQTCKEFEWLVIDDGSIDQTMETINFWMKENPGFEIRYCYKENGGKHRAINYAVPKAHGEYIFIVDSDDELTDDAVEKVYLWISSLDDDELFAGVSGMRGTPNGRLIGNYPSGCSCYIDASNIERRKKGMSGDKAEVYKKDVLEKFPFPEIEGENFITESIVWNNIALAGYKIRWYPDIIYICEYLDDGLTKNLNRIRYNNFNGYTISVKQEIQFEGIYKYWIMGRYFSLAWKKGYKKQNIIQVLNISQFGYFLGLCAWAVQILYDIITEI